MKKNVLWFSRHAMTKSQLSDLQRILGDCHITQVNGSPANVHVSFESKEPEQGETAPNQILTGMQPPLKELIQNFDEVAVVLPINMLQQLLPYAKSNRLLQAVSKRLLTDNGQVQFVHDKWQSILEIKVVTEDL